MSVGNSKTILLVDDSELLLEMARYQLEESGFTVVTASDIAAMRQRLSECSFDLVIADVELPDGSTAALAEAFEGVTAPVWLFSALDEPSLADRAAAVGADGYVCKRDGIETLAARAHALLDT